MGKIKVVIMWNLYRGDESKVKRINKVNDQIQKKNAGISILLDI